MRLRTASAVMAFARALENESAKFYEDLSRRYPEGKDVFLAFARENGKNITHVERAYYSVITDAIEGCFAFDIETDEYALGTVLEEPPMYSEALDKAFEIEGKITKFYNDVTRQSGTLMADVPRAFAAVAKKREGRRPTLELMAKAARPSQRQA